MSTPLSNHRTVLWIDCDLIKAGINTTSFGFEMNSWTIVFLVFIPAGQELMNTAPDIEGSTSTLHGQIVFKL